MSEKQEKKEEKQQDKALEGDEAVAKDAEPAQGGADAKEKQGPAERVAQLEDELLRAKAETQNTIKRMRGDIERAESRGAEAILLSLLNIADELERALEHRDSDNKTAVFDGVAMTLSNIDNVMRVHGLEAVEPVFGDRLDPHVHEAIIREESLELEENKVVRVVAKGYRHRNRILRPAKVVVSVAAAKAEEGAGEKDETKQDEKE